MEPARSFNKTTVTQDLFRCDCTAPPPLTVQPPERASTQRRQGLLRTCGNAGTLTAICPALPLGGYRTIHIAAPTDFHRFVQQPDGRRFANDDEAYRVIMYRLQAIGADFCAYISFAISDLGNVLFDRASVAKYIPT